MQLGSTGAQPVQFAGVPGFSQGDGLLSDTLTAQVQLTMGRIRYKYSFERAPSLEEIVRCFRDVTGLALSAEPLSAEPLSVEPSDCRYWVLTAKPLRGDAEVELEGNDIWVVPDAERMITSSYFLLALVQALHRLGTQRPAPRIPRYARTRWAELPGWRKWLHR